MARFVGLSINKGKQGGGGTITKTDPFTRASGITTDSSNNVTAVTLGDNNYSNILYNNVGLITSYTESIGGVDKIWDLAYDSNNLVTDIVEYIPPPPPMSNWPVNLASLNFAGKIPFYRYSHLYDGAYYGGSASGLFLKPDGTAIYTNNADNVVRRHNMSTPYDISTASQHSVSSPLTAFGSASQSRCIFFKPDGTKLYFGDPTYIRECTLSTPWDITTLSSTSNTFNFSSQLQSNGEMKGFTWKSDGTKIYIVDTYYSYPSPTYLHEYNVSSAWDLGSSITLNQSNYTTLANPSQSHLGNITGISFKPDGTHMYLCSHSNTYAYDWTLNTAWDISSSSMNSNTGNTTYYQATNNFNGYGLNMQWKSDGTRFYVVGGGDECIQEYRASTPWDMGQGAAYGSGNDFKNTAEFVDSWHPYKLFGVNSVYAANFCDNGSKLIITTGNTLYMKVLPTSYDVKSSSSSGATYKSVSGVGWGPQDINFNNDGTKLIVGPEYQNNNIMEFTLSTAYDITTSSTNPSYTLSLNVGSVAGGGHMSTNGMYIFYAQSASVYRWALGTAWDISTANYSASRNFGSGGTVKNLKFSDDGSQMILARGGSDENLFFETYTLSTAWALSTATKVGNSVYMYTDLRMPNCEHQLVWFIGDGKWNFMPYYGAIGFRLSYTNN
tara:strand:+ start:150 stop:2147 length:1998 start_codon:yes stop_codon:yes gene_type:complete